MTRFWNFFVTHYRFTFIVIAAIIVSGMYAIISLPKESDPEVDIPMAVVTTIFPGASPLDVEELVTDPLENEISAVSGVKSMDSTSQSGVSSIVVEFDVNTEKSEVLKDLERAVDSAKRNLPGEAEDPMISEISLSDQAFLQIAIGGDVSLPELTTLANQMKIAAERISGVSKIQVLGGQESEIQVIIDKAILEGFGISIGQVTRAIGAANSDIPIGAIETGNENFAIRLAGRLTSVEDIARIPIGTGATGAVVVVSDVAQVQSGYTTQTSVSRLSIENLISYPAVTLLVYKSSGGDITTISRQVKRVMTETIERDAPSGIAMHTIIDFSEYIQKDLMSLTKNGVATIVIVFLMLLAFLGLREAIMASIAIPLSFLIALTSLLFFDLSINFMTLFSLILALGLLVDSAIVVNQAMHARTAQGEDSFLAAKHVIREFQWPLATSTLTTVFAFVPMLLTSGIIGEFIKSIPITVTSVLLASLFVALAISTTLSAVLSKYLVSGRGPSRTQQYFRSQMDRLQGYYERSMRQLMEHAAVRKRFTRWIVLICGVSFLLPAIGMIDVNMFPTSNEPTFAIDVTLPVGTPLERTSALLQDMEAMLQQDPYITSYVVSVGQLSTAGSAGSGSEHTGYVTVDLVETTRPTSASFVDQYQARFDERFPEATISVSQGNFGPPSEAPVVITLEGPDLDELDRQAGLFTDVLRNIPGTRNVKSSVVETNGAFVMYIDRAAAQRVGLSTTDVALMLRNAINGTVATSINAAGTDVDVVVRYGLSPDVLTSNTFDKTSLETIRSLTIQTPYGASIPLASIADIRFEHSRLTISRAQGQRIAKVTSFTESGTTATHVFTQVQTELSAMQLPDGYTVRLGGENEDIEQSFTDMFMAMILAVFLIAALMVLQFNSFKQMGIIILSIPLALVGVFPGFVLLGLPLSFPGIIGIVALVGIVVSNAIILIDKINKNIYEGGMEKREAIVAAGKARLEPILLTSMTTVFGLLPLSITEEVWRSLGFAIIFGLSSSTILTLVLIPILYNRYIHTK